MVFGTGGGGQDRGQRGGGGGGAVGGGEQAALEGQGRDRVCFGGEDWPEEAPTLRSVEPLGDGGAADLRHGRNGERLQWGPGPAVLLLMIATDAPP
jgi:hypothetical protein